MLFREHTSNGVWPSLQIIAYNQKRKNLIESQSSRGPRLGNPANLGTPNVHSSQRSKLENRKVNFRGRIQAGPMNPDRQRLGYGGGGNAYNVPIPHYGQGPSRGQNGWAINAHRERIEASSKRLVGCVYDRNQINQSRNTLPGTLSSTLPGIRSTVLGGALDVPARSLVVALHTLLSVDAVQ
jgi:hypothetical protein